MLRRLVFAGCAIAGLLGTLPVGDGTAPAGVAHARGSGPAAPATPAPAARSWAFHYGADAPLELLRIHDAVIVEPDHGHDPVAHRERSGGRSELYAYVSVGEVLPTRSWFGRLPAGVLVGDNPAWGSRVVDLAHPDWPGFLAERVVAPLWARGHRGFFLDTLDSWTMVAGDEAARARQQDGLVRTLRTLVERFPGIRLVANRGFEVMDRIAPFLEAVAAESVFEGWDPVARRYRPVPQADRDWLLARLAEVRDRHRLPVIAIDYVDPRDRAKTRETARRLSTLGFAPWVADPDLATVGIGRLELVPRRVLLLHDGSDARGEAHYSPANRLLAMPLQYLGFRVELHDVSRDPLPAGVLADRYAAVVGLFDSPEAGVRHRLGAFLQRAVDEGLKLVFFNSFGTPLEPALARRLGLQPVTARLRAPLSIRSSDPALIGFEIAPLPNRQEALPLIARDGRSLLRLADAAGLEYDGAAILPWGGFVAAPFAFTPLRGRDVSRWVVEPIAFLRAALGEAAAFPVPDPTTEAGRRLLLVHVDGDGFASRAEIPGAPLAAEVMLREFIARYPIPQTVSIIQGETASTGLYAALSAPMEEIARRIFALPHVEIASHSLSHPFNWAAVMAGEAGDRYNLALPGYRFDLEAEVAGSARYIDTRLAPPGKRTQVFLWTGNCVPPAEAIRATQRAGLLNMNGGDTLITRRHPTLTLVAPMSIRKQGALQVFAPNQNENVYTNDWTGPFWGFEQVIETFEMTETPRRLKPVNIYFHTYAASKPASIAALRRVYDWAMAQPLHPVYASEYIRKVIDFEDLAIAREIDAPAQAPVWRIAGDGALRTVRVPADAAARVDPRASLAVAGQAGGRDGHWLHLAAAHARIALRPAEAPAAADGPSVVASNGRLSAVERGPGTLQVRVAAHVPGELTLAHAAGCRVSADGRPLTPTAVPASLKTALPDASGAHVRHFRLPAPRDGADVLVSVGC